MIKLLQQSRIKTQYSPSEHFNRSVRIWEAVLRRAEMDEWLELCKGMKRGMEPLAEALTRLIVHASYSFEDVPGLTYMELGLGDFYKGQYFTPFSIAKMMVGMLLHGFKPPAPGEPPFKMHEPACGSGIMFLAAMEWVEEHFPGSLDRGDVEFSGQDLDPTAVFMCRLNFRLRGIPRAAHRQPSAPEPITQRLQNDQTPSVLPLSPSVEDYTFF